MKTVECSCMSYDFIDILINALVDSWRVRKWDIEEGRMAIQNSPVVAFDPETAAEAWALITKWEMNLDENGKAQELLRHMKVCGTNKTYTEVYLEQLKEHSK